MDMNIKTKLTKDAGETNFSGAREKGDDQQTEPCGSHETLESIQTQCVVYFCTQCTFNLCDLRNNF